MSSESNHFDIPLIGVESEHCALIVDKSLSKVKGIEEHHVELNNHKAVVATDADSETLKRAVQSIRESGYEVATVKKQFPVTGMSCASCAVSVESILDVQQGVVQATVNFAANSVLVEYMPTIIEPTDMKLAVQGVGYDLVIEETEGTKEEL